MKARRHNKLLLLCCLLSFTSFAQNLVPNYSFEDTLSCPDNQAQIYKTPPWFQPTTGTPDYYNECSSIMGIPGAGSQYPKTGKGYAGIFVFSSFLYREYIEAPLISPLIAGKKYCVEFYVNLSDSCNIAIDALGLYFSTGSITSSNYFNLPDLPQIKNPDGNILKDKNNWKAISGEYIAIGGENFITIGNFKDDVNTNSTIVLGDRPESYYYIEDVSVILCDTSQSSLSMPNIFTPNNDAKNDLFKITSNNLQTLNCKIYDRWGLLVGELKNTSDTWNGKTIDGLECADGVYYYILTAKGTDEKEYNQKGFIQLIK